MIIVFTLFIPSSPRWLLSKDREEEARISLRRLRTKAEADEGRCDAEIQTIKEALQENVHKAPWTDLFRGNNFRRTMIVVVYYFFQQVRTPRAMVSETINLTCDIDHRSSIRLDIPNGILQAEWLRCSVFHVPCHKQLPQFALRHSGNVPC